MPKEAVEKLRKEGKKKKKELSHYDDKKNPHSGLTFCRPHGLVWNAYVFSEQTKPFLLLFLLLLHSIWLFPRLTSVMCFIGTSRSFFSSCFVHPIYIKGELNLLNAEKKGIPISESKPTLTAFTSGIDLDYFFFTVIFSQVKFHTSL